MQFKFIGSINDFKEFCAFMGAGNTDAEQLNRIESNTEKIMSDQQVTIQNIKDGFAGAVTGFADVDTTLDSVISLIQQLKDKPELATQEDLNDLSALLNQGKASITDAQTKMASVLPTPPVVATPPTVTDTAPTETTPPAVVEPDPTQPVGTMPTAVDDNTPIGG